MGPHGRLSKEIKEIKEYLGGSIEIKITAKEKFFFSFLKLLGCVPINIRVFLKKHYPHSEIEKKSSLKFYLKKCDLNTKADMPYNKM